MPYAELVTLCALFICPMPVVDIEFCEMPSSVDDIAIVSSLTKLERGRRYRVLRDAIVSSLTKLERGMY